MVDYKRLPSGSELANSFWEGFSIGMLVGSVAIFVALCVNMTLLEMSICLAGVSIVQGLINGAYAVYKKDGFDAVTSFLSAAISALTLSYLYGLEVDIPITSGGGISTKAKITVADEVEINNNVADVSGESVTPGITDDVSSGGSSSKTYMTGTEGEEELANLVGGKPQQYRKTSLGGRYIDQLSDDNIAHESKVGYTTLTKRIRMQILKDAELINTGKIAGAHWHFFTSGVTGKGGASQPLLDFLIKNGISFTIH
jgi:hypothetical protein